jgi:hypothetical protein
MQLGSENDFKVLLDAAVLKGKPEAKLEITESPLPVALVSKTNLCMTSD